jgi:electron transfer flavoprotein alpha subunit
MTILVIAEHDNATLKSATFNTMGAAALIATFAGHDIHILVAGHNALGAAEAATKIAGVSKVLLADAPELEAGLAENVEATIHKMINGYSHVLVPATAYGKNLAPRIAAKLDVAQVSDVTAVVSADTFERPIYAGNAIAIVQSSDAVKVITVRATGFEAVASEGGGAVVERIDAVDAGISQFVCREITKLDRPELTSAQIIISGGRGLGGRRTTQACSSRWPTNLAQRWALRARQSMRALCRMTTRSARRARLSRHNSMLRSEYPARCNTLPG